MATQGALSAMQLHVGDVLGAYRVLRDRGAQGDVPLVEARHLETQTDVVLRWLPSLPGIDGTAWRDMAVRLSRIRHPNVAAVLGHGEHQGRSYLVLEGLSGESLQRRIARGPMEPREACRIMLGVMRGVAEGHAQGMLHGDLKPESIILSESPNDAQCVPKVLDFGVAKLATDTQREHAHTLHSERFCSYAYMSFEQLHSHDDVDGRADVYALAAMLYRLLTGHLPYEAQTPVDLALRMAKEQLVPLNVRNPQFSLELTFALRRALAKDRERRYPTVGALAAALEPFASGAKAVLTLPALRSGIRAKPGVKLRKQWVRMRLPRAVRATQADLLKRLPRRTWLVLACIALIAFVVVVAAR